MAVYPESLTQTDLRPVATLVGDLHLLDEIRTHLQTASHERRLDFVLVEFSHIFDSKHEGKSFEKYTSEGILKLAWTTKRKDLSPAVLGVFFNWGIGPVQCPPADGPDWKGKEGVIIREIRKFREQTRGRTIRFCVIILLPQAEVADPGIEEKAALLRKACDLDSKSLYFISGDFLSMVFQFQRIEKCLFESATNHYKEEIERLKKLKTRAQKEAPGYLELQVRYNFKLGYYSELRQDRESALAYYKRAYQNLQEMTWKSFTEFEEIRTVSDWTILRLYQVFLSVPFTDERITEAITYFQKHFKKYREVREIREPLLEFTKWKWAAEQMGHFGKLLEQVPSELYKTENLWSLPGFYFYNAAMFEKERRKATASEEFLSNLGNWLSFMEANQLRMKDSMYVGQSRTIASHPLQMNITEGLSEKTQLLMTKCLEEAGNNYDQNIEFYLNSAWKFYKSQKTLGRTLASVSTLLSRCYKQQGNLDMSIRFKEGVLKMYKADGWTHIVRELCCDLGECHRALGQKPQMLMYMLDIVKYDRANSLQRYADFLRELTETPIEMDYFCTLISAKVNLTPKTLYKYDEATIAVTLTSHFPTSVEFHSVQMHFNDLNLTQPLASSLHLPPESPATFTKTVVLKSNLIATLEMVKLVFDWRPVADCKLSLVLMRPLPLARAAINQPEPQVELLVERNPTALIGEYLDLSLCIKPKCPLLRATLYIEEEAKLFAQKSTRKASIDRETNVKYRLFIDGSEYPPSGVSFSDISVPTNVNMKLLFYEEDVCSLRARLKYHIKKQLSEEFEYKSELICPIDIQVAAPFQASVLWHYPEVYFQHQEVSDLACLPKNKVCDLAVSLAYAMKDSLLTVFKVVYEAKAAVSQAIGENVIEANGNEGITLAKDESFSCVFQTIPLQSCESSSLGDLLVQWSRVGGSLANCRVPLAPVCVAEQPYEINISYPNEVSVDQTFPYKIRIQSLSPQTISFTLRLLPQVPTFFLWGGYEVMKIKVEKESYEEVEYVLLPVETGLLQLPRLEISMMRDDKREFKETDTGRVVVVLPS